MNNNLVEQIKEKFSNTDMTVEEIILENNSLYLKIINEYKNLYNAFKTIGIKRSSQLKFSEEQVVKILNELKIYGPLNNKIIKKYAPISIDTLKRKFGGLRTLCKKYNIPFDEKTHKFITKEELVKEIYNIINKFGYISKPLMEKHSIYGPKIVNRIFGNFGNMYSELKISRHPSGRVPTDEELLNELKSLYDKYGNVTQDIITFESSYSITCYKDRFGGLNAAKRILNLPENYPGEDFNALYVFKKYSEFLEEDFELEKRFDWLINKDTKAPLRIDCFFKESNLAIEYDGPQHYRITNRYTKTKEQLLYRQKLDLLKNKLCEQNGIKIIRVKYNDKVDKKYIINSLK